MIGIVYFLAGLTLLLGGLRIMRGGLEKAARSRMRRLLDTLAGRPVTALLTGMAVTALVQSSTAITVLAIGFVNAGVMTLTQAVGVILGANIGTCVTVMLISFDLDMIALPTALSGLILAFLGRSATVKYAGQALLGFGLIFTGLKALSDAFLPLHQSPWFSQIVSSIHSPLAAALAGCLFTGMIHSSAATTGIIMALSRQGLLDLPLSIAVIIGGNVGTCITAVIAATEAGVTGKRVALAHVILNLGGAVLFLPLLTPFAALVEHTASTLPRQIANAQIIFNVFSSLSVLPLINGFAWLLTRLIRER